MYHELELIGPDPEGAASGWSVDLKREDSDVVGNVLRKTSTSFVARIGGDATGWSKGRYRFVNNTIITTTGSGAVFRLFDELESVEMHNNVIVTNGTGAPNVMRAAAGEFMWVNGATSPGSNNWVMTGATNVPTQWTGTVMGASPGLTNLTSDPRPAAGSPVLGAGNASPAGPRRVCVPEPAVAARLSSAAARADPGGQRDGAAVRRSDRHRRVRARPDDHRHRWRAAVRGGAGGAVAAAPAAAVLGAVARAAGAARPQARAARSAGARRHAGGRGGATAGAGGRGGATAGAGGRRAARPQARAAGRRDRRRGRRCRPARAARRPPGTAAEVVRAAEAAQRPAAQVVPSRATPALAAATPARAGRVLVRRRRRPVAAGAVRVRRAERPRFPSPAFRPRPVTCPSARQDGFGDRRPAGCFDEWW